MAVILWNLGEKAVLDAWLTGRGSAAAYGTPVTVPDGTAPGNYGLGLGTRVGGVGSTKADVLAQIIELATGTAAGYTARATIARSTGGWPAATLGGGGHYTTSAAQQTFTFTGTPNPNGATLWFIGGSTTKGDDNCLFGADLSATRTFANGDVEKVTATVTPS